MTDIGKMFMSHYTLWVSEMTDIGKMKNVYVNRTLEPCFGSIRVSQPSCFLRSVLGPPTIMAEGREILVENCPPPPRISSGVVGLVRIPEIVIDSGSKSKTHFVPSY
eukprot:TRINITY_DN1314_c0_g1_i14.p1 TRINITY_DN1314_c0_g1~~TRINITY_DN1314_c0_g1_i14.p1  ORF type:complete len:107 (-),score=6.35 TRINITY_DN1314_c0_g1_i14:73-393(-)